MFPGREPFSLMPVLKRSAQVHTSNLMLISSHFVCLFCFFSHRLLEGLSSCHLSPAVTQEMTTLYPVMVLTCRRGIFHRTLKAEQLIVSSWMSNGGLRRSVSCQRRRKERETDAGGEFFCFFLVGFGKIGARAPTADRAQHFGRTVRVCRDESQTVRVHEP